MDTNLHIPNVIKNPPFFPSFFTIDQPSYSCKAFDKSRKGHGAAIKKQPSKMKPKPPTKIPSGLAVIEPTQLKNKHI